MPILVSSTWHSFPSVVNYSVGEGKVLLAEEAVQRGFGNDLIEVILIQGDISPAQLGICLFYPKGIVERKRMADLQKTVQCAAPILCQKLLDMLSVLGSTPPLQKAQKRFIANGDAKTKTQILSKAIKSPNSSSWVENSRNGVSFVPVENPVHPAPSFLRFIIPQNQCYVSRPSLSVKGELPFSALTGA